MQIDKYTKLQPYDPTLYSPIKRLARVGELAILLDNPRGYCVVVVEADSQQASVRFLDDTVDTYHTYPLLSLIPTGKTPQSIIEQYEPTPQELDVAVDYERSLPDFTKVYKKKGKSVPAKKKFDMSNLSVDEKDKIAAFVRRLLQKGGN